MSFPLARDELIRIELTLFLGIVGFMKGSGLLWHPLVSSRIQACLNLNRHP